MEPGGAVLNADNPHYARLRARRGGGCARVIGFGAARRAARLRDARSGQGSDVVMTLEGREIAFRIGAPGGTG